MHCLIWQNKLMKVLCWPLKKLHAELINIPYITVGGFSSIPSYYLLKRIITNQQTFHNVLYLLPTINVRTWQNFVDKIMIIFFRLKSMTMNTYYLIYFHILRYHHKNITYQILILTQISWIIFFIKTIY